MTRSNTHQPSRWAAYERQKDEADRLWIEFEQASARRKSASALERSAWKQYYSASVRRSELLTQALNALDEGCEQVV